jgi:hypothetical protein
VHVFIKQTLVFLVYPAKVQLFPSDGSNMEPSADNSCTFAFGVQIEAVFQQNRCTFAFRMHGEAEFPWMKSKTRLHKGAAGACPGIEDT